MSDDDFRWAAKELLRRRLCQRSFPHFVLYHDIPGCPPALKPDVETLDMLGGPEGILPRHHYVICKETQDALEKPHGRLLIMAPPGSAKSSYVSVAAPAWAAGRWPNEPTIITSYASTLAERQSSRAQQMCATEEFKLLWDEQPVLEKDSVKYWALSNKSTVFAAGLTAGITGSRARQGIIDDPVAGREEADSSLMRAKTRGAYFDDFKTRLKPEGSIIMILTRWHELDLAGDAILPDDYNGESGDVLCKDGRVWRVLNIPAKAERADDPLGREIGEYLWPEYFTPGHWLEFENAAGEDAARVWAALYQQNPTPQGSGAFTRDMFNWYEPGELPPQLMLVGASDYAVTKDGGDKTEHGVWGFDHSGNLWALDWWTGQETTDVSIDAFLTLVAGRKVMYWFNEGGVIDKSVRPAINRRMRERGVFVVLQSLPSMQDKVAKVQSFRARAAAKSVWLPKGVTWAEDLVQQLCALPAGRYDDKADVAGLIGRAVDKVPNATLPAIDRPRGIEPFSVEWLEYEDPKDQQEVRYR